jgi:hypothetical protein
VIQQKLYGTSIFAEMGDHPNPQVGELDECTATTPNFTPPNKTMHRYSPRELVAIQIEVEQPLKAGVN